MEYNGEITEINPGTWVFFVNEISTAETFGDLSPRITPDFLLRIRAVIQWFSLALYFYRVYISTYILHRKRVYINPTQCVSEHGAVYVGD